MLLRGDVSQIWGILRSNRFVKFGLPIGRFSLVIFFVVATKSFQWYTDVSSEVRTNVFSETSLRRWSSKIDAGIF